MPRCCRCIWLTVFALTIAAPALAQDPARDRSRSQESEPGIGAHLTELVALYRHLHSHPELSFREEETARRIAEELKKTGADVTTGVGKLGVVGVLKNGSGATVLVRTDLDALPVVEETGLRYASKVKTTDSTGREVGVMHACGHDVHMTCLVGTAQWLAEHRDRWSGTVVLIGQPAEELVGGAKAMLEDGLYTRFPRPDYALALHVMNEIPSGIVGYTVGPTLASSTGVDVTIRGRGGHGAAPHTTVDPIVLAALAILDFQTIVSREIDPTQSAVVTVGTVHGGTKGNIIPDEVKLQLTLRSFREDVRDQLIDGIKRRVNGLAQAHRAPAPIVEVRETTPPLISTPSLVERVVPALRRTLGEAKVREFGPVMGAEDFGLYGQGGVPTFMFRLGTTPEKTLQEAKAKGEPIPGLHSSKYQPDPALSIETGVRAMVAAVRELLPR
jgi:hippurate hydrolase